MTTTPTIDLISYKNTVADTTGNNSSKSYMENSSDFSNVLENANKSYSANNETEKNNDNQQNSKVADTSNKKEQTDSLANTAEKKEDTNIENKVDNNEKNTQGRSSDDNNSEVVNDYEDTENVDNKITEDINPSEDKAETLEEKVEALRKLIEASGGMEEFEKANLAKINEKIKSLGINIDEATIKELIRKVNNVGNNIANLQTGSTEITKEPAQITQGAQATQAQPQSEINSNMIENADIKLSATEEKVIDALTLNAQVEKPSDKLNVDNKISENVDLLESTKTKTANESVDFIKTLANFQSSKNTDVNAQTKSDNVANQQINNLQQESTAGPLVEASQEVITSNQDAGDEVSSSEVKQNVKTISNKTSLTQEVLDKLNAKIVSMDNTSANTNTNTNTNSNNFSNQQTAQEQVVKISLESNSAVQSDIKNVETANLQGTTNQTNFAKTFDSIQSQSSPQVAYVYKEIDDSEIISQLNNKLSALKDEGTTKINIVLKPEHLGKISLELINSKEGITAQMTTDNPQVKEVLDKTLNSLRENLSSHGVNVNNVSVKVEETQKQSNETLNFEDNRSNQGNQDSSENPKQNNGKSFKFAEEVDNFVKVSDVDEEIFTAGEKSVSIDSNLGRISYKV